MLLCVQVLDKENQMDNPCSWLPEPAWDNISELDKLTNFHGIVMSFEQYSRDWNIWYTSAEPETSVFPGQQQQLNALSPLLLPHSQTSVVLCTLKSGVFV